VNGINQKQFLPMKLALQYEVKQAIGRHAEEAYPDECCGFFFGGDGEIRTISHVRRATNTRTENRGRRFRIDTDEYRKAEKYAVDHGLDLLGIYHSHPDHPAEPSEHDRSVAMPFFSYIIVSVTGGTANDIRSWRLNEEETFDEESVTILSKQENAMKPISE
jgi:proteasome lid subunit RPN8/RPN11